MERITVITCAPNVPDGRVYEGHRNPIWPRQEQTNGVDVVRVWTYIRPDPGKIDLILNYVSYLISSLIAATFFVRRPDVYVATTPQFFCGIAGVLASWIKWRPLVLEVRDIWPESIVEVGAIKRGALIRILERMERWMYRGARHIVAVGPGYRDNILGKVDVKDRISIVTNGVVPNKFSPRPRPQDFAERYELNERFVCSYIGTVGMAHGLNVIVRTAKRLKDANEDRVVFLIVGGGSNLCDLRATVQEEGLEHWIKLTGRLDKSEMPDALAVSDVCLVHLSKVDLFQHVIPSKIFEAMSMERPIVMGVFGTARQIVMSAHCGVEMEPENDSELFDILIQMISDPSEVADLGRNGRKVVLDHFDRDDLANDMLEVLAKTAEGQSFRLPDRTWTHSDQVSDSVPSPDSKNNASGPV